MGVLALVAALLLKRRLILLQLIGDHHSRAESGGAGVRSGNGSFVYRHGFSMEAQERHQL